MRIRFLLPAFLILLAPALPVSAWSNHALIGYVVFHDMPEAKKTVNVESLEQFLARNEAGLAALLDEEEAWARANVPGYPERPDGLKFGSGKTPIRERFVAAIRINPTVPLAMSVMPSPGDMRGRPSVPWQKISILKIDHVNLPFAALGGEASALEVLASACDEPDFGHDINIWADNSTPYGNAYNFGNQPFGNPRLEYASQAPFHMGFFHEAGIVYAAAPFLKRTFPEARAHLFLSLSRYAFKKGHPYWGYRFAGWGLHYIQDLTQPYHANVLPSRSAIAMIFINILDMIGIHGPKKRAIEHVSNTHNVLEKIEQRLIEKELKAKNWNDPLLTAMRDMKGDSAYPSYTDQYIRATLTKQSNGWARPTDDDISAAIPSDLLEDPDLGDKINHPKYDLLGLVEKAPNKDQLLARMRELLTATGAHSRNYLRAAVAQ